ncbi:MAG: response regulator [Chitinispirillia bacterium]|nr:response regulator [Chitinispirillia bacterium]
MKKKILLIDDDTDSAALAKLVLETDMFEVNTVFDSEEAYETAKEYRPDAILLDLEMPKLDGWTVFRILRGDNAFDNVPIAIISGKGESFDHMVGLHVMKADAYISKPFGKQELIDKTHELINRKK